MTTLANEETIWEQYRYDDWYYDDLPYAKQRFFNVSKEMVLNDFAKNVIEPCDELRFTPPILFNKYFPLFIEFVLIGEHSDDKANEVASCFMKLLDEKLDKKEFNNIELINYALTAVEFLKNNIDFFNNHPDIYGELRIELASVTQKLTSYKVS